MTLFMFPIQYEWVIWCKFTMFYLFNLLVEHQIDLQIFSPLLQLQLSYLSQKFLLVSTHLINTDYIYVRLMQSQCSTMLHVLE